MNGFHLQVVCQVNCAVDLNMEILIPLLLYKATLNLPSMIPLISAVCTHNNGIVGSHRDQTDQAGHASSGYSLVNCGQLEGGNYSSMKFTSHISK